MNAPWWEGELWAMAPEKLRALLGMQPSAFFAPETQRQDERAGYQLAGRNAVIGIRGVLAPRATFWSMVFGHSTYDQIGAAVIRANADDAVDELVLDIDSPGGLVSGLTEAAQVIAQSRKPVTVYVSGEALSAAYTLASQADRIVASPTAMVGCLGVIYTAGFRPDREWEVTFISSSTPHKCADPKTAEGAEQYQAQVDGVARVITDVVARGRGIDAKKASKQFGEGRTVVAAAALAAGMIDEVRTGLTPAREEETMGKTNSKLSADASKVEDTTADTGAMDDAEETEGAEKSAEELQAELDAAHARIEELEAEVARLDDGEDEGAAASAAARDRSAVLEARNRQLEERLQAVEQHQASTQAALRHELIHGDNGIFATGKMPTDDASVRLVEDAYDREMAARLRYAMKHGCSLEQAAQKQDEYRVFSDLQARPRGASVPMGRVTHGEPVTDSTETAEGLSALFRKRAEENKTDYETERRAYRRENPDGYRRVFGG